MDGLRAEAERLLATGTPSLGALPVAEPSELVHQLQLHELELRMQNDALREAHSALDASLARYRELFEHAPVGFAELSDSAALLAVNPAAAALLGQKPEPLIGARLTSYMAESSVVRFAQHRVAVLANTSAVECEVELQMAPNGVREVRLISRREEARSRWRMAIVDVTEVNALQRRLSQAQKLEALGTLAAGVAHDFNNTLTAIIGCAELARGKLGSESEAQRSLQDLLGAAQRARSLTRQLLFAVRSPVATCAIDLHSALRAGMPLLRELAAPRATLEMQLNATNPRVLLDHGLLEQVLLNLVRNAADALDQAGVIRIETRDLAPSEVRAVLTGAPSAERYCLLTVVDAGCGMTPEVMQHAFEPFYTTKRAGSGTGLGLWMVHGAITQAGGHVELTSAMGQGTSVKIYLPCS
ncbi:MAG TPA: ATP-binding protein [Polyangiales bacterium]|nr:ATP-binding protein [Polyangiales bacterium]